MFGIELLSPCQYWITSFLCGMECEVVVQETRFVFETVSNVVCNTCYFRSVSLEGEHVTLTGSACVCWFNCGLG